MNNVEKIIEIIKEELGSELDPAITIAPDLDLAADLHVDSLDKVLIVGDIEKAFEVVFTTTILPNSYYQRHRRKDRRDQRGEKPMRRVVITGMSAISACRNGARRSLPQSLRQKSRPPRDRERQPRKGKAAQQILHTVS